MLAIARAVQAAGAHVLRGGAFKPRTSPYSFQGLREEGLALLARARAETGLPVVTEVMDPRQIDLVSAYADILQIGSRNMQNFPLLEEVGRCRLPVLLKRGMSATIDEYLHAAEYVLRGGNTQVILCERGIRTFEPSTRNTLDLNAIPMLHRETHLPVLVDPSHGTGHAWMVPRLAAAAVAAGADGLLVEVHHDPAQRPERRRAVAGARRVRPDDGANWRRWLPPSAAWLAPAAVPAACGDAMRPSRVAVAVLALGLGARRRAAGRPQRVRAARRRRRSATGSTNWSSRS